MNELIQFDTVIIGVREVTMINAKQIWELLSIKKKVFRLDQCAHRSIRS